VIDVKKFFCFTVLITVVASLALLAGCGGVTNPESEVVVLTGGVNFAIGDSGTADEATAESVTSRWANWKACVVTVKNDTTSVVIGTVILTPSSPSGSITGIAGGTKVRVYASLYADAAKAKLITTGTSAQGTIVAGSNISLPITLTATKPALTVVSPTNGSTVNDDNVSVVVDVTDLGAAGPSVALTDNGTTVTTTPTITGDTLTGYVWTWALTQTDGDHAMVLTATSTSHVSSSNSGTSSTSWSYSVDNTGGLDVIISGVDEEAKH